MQIVCVCAFVEGMLLGVSVCLLGEQSSEKTKGEEKCKGKEFTEMAKIAVYYQIM